MKCRHCRKEIINENANYCEHCGEGLIKEDLINANIDTSYNDQINKEQINGVKEAIKKNKIIIGIVAAAIVVLIVVVNIFSYLKGRPLNDDRIKDAIKGRKVTIGTEIVKLSEKNIKDMEIKKRETTDKESDKVTLEIKLKVNKKYNAKIKYIVTFSYNDEWKFDEGVLVDVVSVDTATDMSDEIIKTIKEKESIQIDDSYDEIESYLIKDIKNLKTKKDKNEYSFSGDIILSNGLYYTEGKLQGTSYIDLNNLEISVSDCTVSDLEDAKKEKKKDDELIEKVIKEQAFSSNYAGGASSDYTYKVDDKDEVEVYSIYMNDVSNIKVINMTEKEEDNLLRLEIEAKANNGDIKSMELKGVVNVPLKIGEDADTSSEFQITKIETKDITKEYIEENLLDMEIDNNSILKSDAKSFKETARDNKYVGKKYINGTIMLDNKEVKIQIVFKLKCTNDYNKDNELENNYKWEIQNIYKENEIGYLKF